MDDERVPVYPTIASQFNDPGISWMFCNLVRLLREKFAPGSGPKFAKGQGSDPSSALGASGTSENTTELGADPIIPFLTGWPLPETPTEKEPTATILIPGNRVRYLAEIAEQGRDINADIQRQAKAASLAQNYYECLKDLEDPSLPAAFDAFPQDALLGSEPKSADLGADPFIILRQRYNSAMGDISKDGVKLLKDWPARKEGIRTAAKSPAPTTANRSRKSRSPRSACRATPTGASC
jgi:methylmalonyl-CoA mutase